MSAAKQKGTAAETAVVTYLSQFFDRVERRTLSGKNDKGDISLDKDFVIEVKNHQRMELATWCDEAITEKANAGARFGVVWHKRTRKGSPGDWYVTMSGEDFTNMVADVLFARDVRNQLDTWESNAKQLPEGPTD